MQHKMVMLKAARVKGRRAVRGETVVVSKWTRAAFISSGKAQDLKETDGGHGAMLSKFRKLKGRKRFGEAKALIKSQYNAVATSWDEINAVLVAQLGEGLMPAGSVVEPKPKAKRGRHSLSD